MSEHIKRMESELNGLVKNLERLVEFISLQETLSKEERVIDKTQYTMLKVQQQSMETYAYVLAARIEYDTNK